MDAYHYMNASIFRTADLWVYQHDLIWRSEDDGSDVRLIVQYLMIYTYHLHFTLRALPMRWLSIPLVEKYSLDLWGWLLTRTRVMGMLLCTQADKGYQVPKCFQGFLG